MAIQVIDKRVRESILDVDGNQIGEICFNPDDTATYEKFLDITDNLISGQRKLNDIKIGEAPSELSSIEDFENAGEFFRNVRKATIITNETVDQFCKEFNAIFGDGVCELFLQGSHDVELLNPLIDGIIPFFKKARTDKVGKYQRNSKKSVLK